MELHRGVCSLCSESKILSSTDAEEFTNKLPQIFNQQFFTEADFQNIKNQIKLCIICCHKIHIAKELRNAHETQENIQTGVCYFCNCKDRLIKYDKRAKFFTEKCDEFLDDSNHLEFICFGCIYLFDLLHQFKMKLIFRFPQLTTNGKTKSQSLKNKDQHTPKRKLHSASPPGSKRRKIFDNCFTYLEPLSKMKYHIADEIKKDKRLYRKIAYVNLLHSKDVEVKETPKRRPIIKIKLKTKNRKDKDGKKHYVKVSHSEEIPREKTKASKKRFSLGVRNVEEESNNINETPKSAIVSYEVPKRRVSAYMDNDGEKENEEKAKTSETEEENTCEENLVKETVPLTEEVSIDENKNGLEKLAEDGNEEKLVVEPVENITNGENTESNESANTDTQEFDQNPSSPISKSSSKSDTSDSSDYESQHAKEDQNNAESDALNGSERKKKRVTFSDEVDNN